MILPTANGVAAPQSTHQSKAKLDKTQVGAAKALQPRETSSVVCDSSCPGGSFFSFHFCFLLRAFVFTDFLLEQHICSRQHGRPAPHLQVQPEGKVPHLAGGSLPGLPQPGGEPAGPNQPQTPPPNKIPQFRGFDCIFQMDLCDEQPVSSRCRWSRRSRAPRPPWTARGAEGFAC